MFAAGAGPGSGAARKDTMDRGGAVLLADAAELAGVRRYVMVSAMGADAGRTADHDEVFAAYIAAKKAADDDIRARDLDWTILRPGGLTMASGTGLVELAEHTERGQIPREDVAAVLLALLDEPRTAGLSLDLIRGDRARSTRPSPRWSPGPPQSPHGAAVGSTLWPDQLAPSPVTTAQPSNWWSASARCGSPTRSGCISRRPVRPSSTWRSTTSASATASSARCGNGRA